MTEQEKLLITKYELLFESYLEKTEATMDYMCKYIDESFKEMKSALCCVFCIILGSYGILLGLMA